MFLSQPKRILSTIIYQQGQNVVTKLRDDIEYFAEDDYANALLGDPGLVLRVEQLAQLKAGNKFSHELDVEKLSHFIPQSAVISEFTKTKSRWSENILNLFKRENTLKNKQYLPEIVKTVARF